MIMSSKLQTSREAKTSYKSCVVNGIGKILKYAKFNGFTVHLYYK